MAGSPHDGRGVIRDVPSGEAFLLFCLLIDPDPPTWRAWLGYHNSTNGRDFNAPKRNAAAYLRLLKGADDVITDTVVEALAGEGRPAVWVRSMTKRESRMRAWTCGISARRGCSC